MRTIRRLYIYLVTLISLELVVWGLINLLQTSLSSAVRGAPNLLASGLALVLVGLPFFLLHGWLAQREARRDPEEQSSRMRAVFHYAARLALLSPAVMELYNLVRDPLQTLLSAGITAYSPATPLDRVISIVINAAAWALMERLLRSDWRATPAGEALIEVRRLSRYVWMIFGLALGSAGVFGILQVLLDPSLAVGTAPYMSARLVDGLALTLVGVPLWLLWWLVLQRTCDLPEERPSTLRRAVLYLVTLVSAVVVLFAAGSALDTLMLALLGNFRSIFDLRQQTFQPVALVILFGVLWGYFSRQVLREWAVESDDLVRAGLRRLYHYPLAAAGNAAAFTGAWKVLGVIVQMLLGTATDAPMVRGDLAFGIALLLVGAPYWLAHWPRMQAEAGSPEEMGDHARRSVLRKTYLYLAVFLTVIGLMSAAGVLFYRLINAALGSPGNNLVLECWQQVSLLALLGVWLGYHFTALRSDGRLAQRTLVERQAAFGVLVLQTGEDAFYPALREALQRQAPNVPASFHVLAGGPPPLEMAAAQALVLPASAALAPDPGLQQWLAAYPGRRVVVPLPAPSWVWAGQPPRSARDLALDTAVLLRQLAEGEAPHASAPNNPWVITGYVLGAFFAAILALVLLSALFGGF